MSKHPADKQPDSQTQPVDHTQPCQGYFVPAPPQYDVDKVDIFAYWDMLVRYKRTILLVTIVITTLATAAAFIMTPKYRADVLMAPVTEEENAGAMAGLMNQFGGLASLAGIGIPGGGEVYEAVATLKSRAFTEKFINDKKLLPVLFYKRWDAEKSQWNVDDANDIPTMWDAYNLFNEKIRGVSIDNKTNLVTLSIVWKDRDQAVQWANILVQRVNKTLRARAIAESKKSLSYLNKELVKTSVMELQQVIYRLIEGQTNKIMLANVREEYAFKVIDPAVVPDADEFVKPNRKLIITVGGVLGFFVGVVVAFILNLCAMRRLKTESG